MERTAAMDLGVVVERRAIDHRWARWRWRPVAVIPGAGPVADWLELERDPQATRWHAATLPLGLHRKETQAYLENLQGSGPSVYVVLREMAGAPEDRRFQPFLVTASPFEAQDYLDPGEDVVERVPMPAVLTGWIQAFIDRHHVDEPFRKRKRQRHDPDRVQFGQAPDHPDPAARRRRLS